MEKQIGKPLVSTLVERDVLPLVSILVRLHADDLARNKLVCKGWCKLISSSDFINLHLERSKSDPLSHQILTHGPYPSKPRGPLKSVISLSAPTTALVGSVNGLVCIAGNNMFDKGSSVDDIWILNPVTGQARKLPPPASPFDKRGYDKATFAFWWDSDYDGYKVFKICSISSAKHIEAWESSDHGKFSRPIESNTLEVWDSSSSDSWSGVDMCFNHPFHHPRGPATVSSCDVAARGFAYWIVVDGGGCDSFIFSLNMKTHAVRTIALPQISTPTINLIEQFVWENENSLLFLVSWEGWRGWEMCLVEQEKGLDRGFPHYNVWMLVDVSNPYWIKIRSFCVDFIVKKCLNDVNGKLLLELDNGRMILCDMKTQPVLGSSGEMLGSLVEGHGDLETQFYNNEDWDNWDLFCTWHEKKEKGYPLSFNQYKTYVELQTSEEDSDFDRIFVKSAHDFVGSLLSIKGSTQAYDNCPVNYVAWPNRTSFGRVAKWKTKEEQSEEETYKCGWE